jgi:ParB/RepB/Spo0J family partition protein
MYKVEDIPVDLLRDNPYDQRKRSGDIEGLAESIKERGLQNPISVIKVDQHFVIVSGHRRAHAYRYLKRKKIPAIIRKESTPEDLMIDLAIENMQRKDLLPTEKGAVIEQLFYTIPNVQKIINGKMQLPTDRIQSLLNQVKVYGKTESVGEGFTDEDVIKAKHFLNMIGMATTTASIYIRLCSLPEEIQRYVINADNTSLIPEGYIVTKSAYELTRVSDPKLQKDLFQKAVQDKMSHIELKHIVDELIQKDDNVARKSHRGSAKRKTEDDAGITRLTEELLTLSSSIENFRYKYLPVVSGRLEKVQWTASLNKMKKVCMDTVKNINDLLHEDMKNDELLEYANADLEINITGDMRYKFPSRVADILKVKEGDILSLKVEGIKRFPPKLDEVRTNELQNSKVLSIDIAETTEENIEENHDNRIDIS